MPTTVDPISEAIDTHEKLDPRLAALLELDDHVFDSVDPVPPPPPPKPGEEASGGNESAPERGARLRSFQRRSGPLAFLRGLRPNDRVSQNEGFEAAEFSSVPVFVTAKSEEALETIRRGAGILAWKSRVGTVATADMGIVHLREIERYKDLVSVEWTGGAKPTGGGEGDGLGGKDEVGPRGVEPRRAIGLGDLPASLNGKDVVIGVVDCEGLDFYHPDFLIENKYPRVISLWDQTAEHSEDHRGTVPDGYGYGVVYSYEDIRQELNPNRPRRYSSVPHQALKVSHGTMVAGVAAGGGIDDPSARGVAPGADIVFVDTAGSGAGALAAMTEIAEAVHHVFEVAGDRPCVVNVSLGDALGPHDGDSPAERYFDELLAAKPGRAIVIAAGNYHHEKRHAAGRLDAATQTATLGIEVRKGGGGPFGGGGGGGDQHAVVEIWYDRVEGTQAGIAVTIASPKGDFVTREVLPDGLPKAFDLGETRLLVASVKQYPGTRDALIRVEMFPKAADGQLETGTFRVQLRGDGVNRDFHAWLDHPTFRLHAEHAASGAPADVTVTSPGTCKTAITVGACHHESGKRARFSGVGPCRHDVDKPDLLACGVRVRCPRASSPERYYSEFTGTSAAAPLVTGAIALVFQHAWEHGKHLLTAAETGNLVRKAARRGVDRSMLVQAAKSGGVSAESEAPAPPSRLMWPEGGALDELFAAAGIRLRPAGG